MAYTAGYVIDQAQIRYNDLTDAVGLLYAQEIHNDILQYIQLIYTTITIPIVAGQNLYTLPPNVLKMWECYYLRSNTVGDGFQMRSTNSRELDRYRKRWPLQQNEEPRWRYIGTDPQGALAIGIYPFPYLSTSSGYPILSLNVSEMQTITSDAFLLPAAVFDPAVYKVGIMAKHAQTRDPEAADGLWAMYTQMRDLLAGSIQTADADYTPRVDPYIGQTARRT